ncbi:MAG: ATP-binding protein [Methylococcales bacterium]|jgi:hypothetical protein|nr:ATP-binding protein [Methylococcales bacterium]MBT7444480.1 ATP-binding protein [Methylococcales bacterium]
MNKVIRLILIDAYKDGDIVKVDLDGNTNLNGDNGAGKTTLLKIAPIFYGAAPGKLVRRTGNIDSFVDYYLKHLHSYIIFEYEREGDTMMVAIYRRNANEKTAYYRFIHSPYQKSLFFGAENDNDKVIEGSKLSSHLKLNNIECSGAMSGEDYKLVMQSNTTYNSHDRKKNKRINQYRRQYSFCRQGTNMDNVDLITTAILGRTPSLFGIKEIIKTILLNTEAIADSEIKLQTSAKNLQDWANNVSSYQDFDQKLHLIDALNNCKADYDNCKNSLNTVYSIASAQTQQLASTTEHSDTAVKNSEIELQKSLQKLASETDVFQQHSSALTHQIENHQKDVTVLTKEHDEWQTKQVESLRQLHQQLPEHQAEKTQKDLRLKQITEGASDIVQQYDQLIADQNSNQQRKQNELNTQNNQISSDAKDQKAQLTERYKDKRATEHQHYEQQLENFEQNIKTVWQQHASIEAQIPLCQAPSTLLKEQHQLREHINSAHQKSHHFDESLEQENHAQQQNNAAITALAERYHQEQQEKRQLTSDYESIKHLLSENKGSLLNFLRDNHPSWTENISKVIPEALLLRKDLQPEVSDTTNTSLYGVQLDLSSVETQRAADEASLLKTHHTMAQKSTELDSRIQQSEQDNKPLIKNQQALSQTINTLLQNKKAHQKSITNAQIELKQLTDKIQLAIASEKQTLSSQAKAIKVKITSQEQHKRDLTKQHHNQLKQIDRQEADEKHDITEACIEQLGLIQKQFNEHSAEHLLALKTLEQEKLQALAQNGVDTNTVKALESQLKTVQQKIKQALSAETTIKDYEYWQQHQWSRHSEIIQIIDANNQQLDQINQQWQHDKANQEAHITFCKQRLQQHKTTLSTQQAELNKLLNLNEQLKDDNAAYQTTDINITSLHTAEWLMNEYLQLKDQLRQYQNTGRKQYNSLIKTMKQHINSSAEQYANRMEAEISKLQHLPEEYWLHSVEQLTQYAETGHREDKDNLVIYFQGHGANITDYFSKLKDTDKKINGIGNKITHRISELSSNIKELGELEVKISSKLTTLDYWLYLEKFSERYTTWHSRDHDVLPDDDLIEQLKNIADIIAETGLNISIINHFDVTIYVTDQGKKTHARTDDELKNISSTGLSYLIIIMIYTAMANMLRGRSETSLIWPVDELKNFSEDKIDKIMQFLNRYDITIFSAFPDPDPDVFKHYQHKYLVGKGRQLISYALSDIDYSIQDLFKEEQA